MLSFQASHCKLKDLSSIRELVSCKALSCVDLQQNKIVRAPYDPPSHDPTNHVQSAPALSQRICSLPVFPHRSSPPLTLNPITLNP
jgi:hypothetical protein